MKPTRTALIVLLVALMGGNLLFPQQVAAADQGVQPAHAPAGSQFAFFATGFAADEKVSYWANDPLGRVYEGGMVRANALHRADWTWASPPDALPGRWSMVARGNESQIERVVFFAIDDVSTLSPAPPDSPINTALPSPTAVPVCQGCYDQAVSPREGAPGTAFSIFARGFKKYERVIFRAFAPDGRMYEIGAFGTNEFGRVDWTWESPTSLVPGTWTITATGDQSQVERVMSVSIIGQQFPEIAEPIDPLYDSAVSPERGTAGTTFRFYASNFSDGEVVSYEVIGPDGLVYEEGEAHAKYWNLNRIDWLWESPDDAPAGEWTAIARGHESKIQRVISFEVYEHDAHPRVPTQNDPYQSATVFPGEGPAGTEFAFFGEGFDAREPVDYVCIDPDGIVQASGSMRSTEDGRADWRCPTSCPTTPGIWTSTITGRKSHRWHILYFTVNAGACSGTP